MFLSALWEDSGFDSKVLIYLSLVGRDGSFQ